MRLALAFLGVAAVVLAADVDSAGRPIDSTKPNRRLRNSAGLAESSDPMPMMNTPADHGSYNYGTTDTCMYMGMKYGGDDWSCPTDFRLPDVDEYALAEGCLLESDVPYIEDGQHYTGIGWSATGVFDDSLCNCNWAQPPNGWCSEPSIDTMWSGGSTGRACGDYAQIHICVQVYQPAAVGCAHRGCTWENATNYDPSATCAALRPNADPFALPLSRPTLRSHAWQAQRRLVHAQG